jgi:CO/xanthine dehydrogenase FAD-binding subunit
VIKNRFQYLAPKSAEEAARLLAESPADTEVIGGGTWVVVEMTAGSRDPRRVIDLKDAGLRYVKEEGGNVVIGARATYTDVARSAAAAKLPALVAMCTGITGGAQLRNRATIAGSACYANPSADAHGLLVGLGATFTIRSASGTRQVAAADFYKGAFDVDVKAGEIVESISIPVVAGVKQGYYKFKVAESSWPVCTGTAVIAGDGTARVTIGAANTTPVTVTGSASDLDGLAAAAEAAITSPHSDELAKGDYRKQIAGAIAKRAVKAAV